MAGNHNNQDGEKIVYVGDSRIRKNRQVLLPRDYSAYPGKSEAFIPNFLLKEWMVAVVVLVGILVLTIQEPAPLGYPADPTKTDFIPIPDWYFLFMYQLLKYSYLAEKFVVFGTVVLPGLLFGGLTIAPFLDTGKERRFYRRPVASGLMLLSLAAVVYLTIVSWSHYTHELEARGIVPEHHIKHEEVWGGHGGGGSSGPRPGNAPIINPNDPGMDLYRSSTCLDCHGSNLLGMPAAHIPGLRAIGDKYTRDELMDIVRNGIGAMSGQYERNINERGLTDASINQLVDWLALQKREE